MKSPFNSIQWRVQLWHGAVLLLVLAAFGFRLLSLNRENRFSLIDRDLQKQIILVAAAMKDPKQSEAIRRAAAASSSSQQRSPKLSGPKSPAPELDLANPKANTLASPLLPGGTGFPSPVSRDDVYYAGWNSDDSIIFRSTNAPPDLTMPGKTEPLIFYVRARGELREQVIMAPSGLRLLAGRSIAADLADLRQFTWRIIVAGCGLMALGLLTGWWIATRAIRPINDISAAAQKIASGDLSERIDVADTDSELGQLARILNSSFDRVQKAFNELQRAFDRQARFTADASHELRTPVSVVLAESNSALSRERTPAEYKEALETCRETSRKMRQLIESLLTLARLDASGAGIYTEVCQLDLTTHDSVRMLKLMAEEHGVSLECDLQPARCPGDSGQLGQLATNLISNAICYSSAGGRVLVHTSLDNGSATLRVTDAGSGIAEKDLPHIFERFYRADKARTRASGHFGLGLAISKGIVELHGGTIEAASALGQGSTFTVRLPARCK